jgi:hypothetical protein
MSDSTLSALFASAESIGAQYQTDEEREEFSARYLAALEVLDEVLAEFDAE